ncbi:MAG: hypothetical protein QOF63_3564 [Thermoanaerobaculia bacterium]|jgi:hypothetical protein|nr:hypothetical protein [Thermoanaerobaculia bacterium]
METSSELRRFQMNVGGTGGDTNDGDKPGKQRIEQGHTADDTPDCGSQCFTERSRASIMRKSWVDAL